MISLDDPVGDKTFFHIFMHSFLLWFVSTLLFLLFQGGLLFIYLLSVTILNGWFLLVVYKGYRERSQDSTKAIVLSSVVYLALLSFTLVFLKALEIFFF